VDAGGELSSRRMAVARGAVHLTRPEGGAPSGYCGAGEACDGCLWLWSSKNPPQEVARGQREGGEEAG
jgi:hypothetical protein